MRTPHRSTIAVPSVLSSAPARTVATGALFALATASAASAQWTAVSLHPPGAAYSRALATSGAQHVGEVDGHAALWTGTASSYVDLGEGVTFATDGQRQVGTRPGPAATLWAGTAASAVDLSPLRNSPSSATGIDGHTQTGGYAHSTIVYGGTWNDTAESFLTVGPSGGPSSNLTNVRGVHAGRQVGGRNFSSTPQAYLWNGHDAPAVVLHPAGAGESTALAIHGGSQVGWSKLPGGAQRAALWFGTSASYVDLHPAGATTSVANAVHGSLQVGQVDGRATLWTGTAGSLVDLAASLPPWFTTSSATGIWTAPDGTTYVSGTARSTHDEAILWIGTPSAATSFCAGDGSGTACPCANESWPGRGEGCRNTTNAGGQLAAVGSASIAGDTFALVGNGMPNSSVLYFQGTTRTNGGAGSAFGDGLRCASGTVVRLGSTVNVAGSSRYPDVGDATISVRGSNAAGDVRAYQAWYRNAAPFCTPSTFNTTNGVEVTWQP